MTSRTDFFAPCPKGVEPLLADELRRLRLRGVRPQRGGVLFSGSLRDAYTACLWSRFASRVLMSLGDLDATTADTLYEGVREIAWEDHVHADGTIIVDAVGVNAALRNTQFTAVRVKDAVADRFRERGGVRPSVDAEAPDLRINIVVGQTRARLSIDLSGDPLHRRGYRRPGRQVTAPMKETLAAAVLELGGWRAIAERGGGFVDPMCGSGTIAIEAAMVAGDIAPGLLRQRWGFDRWLGHDEDAWHMLLDRADGRCDAGRDAMPPILASDFDAAAIDVARDCVKRAGLERLITLEVARMRDIEPPSGAVPGLIATNPPYGERLSERAELPELYRELGDSIRARFDGWALAVISPDAALPEGLGMRAAATTDLYNGRILAPVRVFAPGASVPIKPLPVKQGVGSLEAPDAAATAFSNRLKKMAKHVGTWARKTGVTCYRVYDADLPDYNVAIDIYHAHRDGTRFAHIAEYAPPTEIDHDKASLRMQWAEAVVADVLEVDPANVFVKRRERQRGSAQYTRQGLDKVTSTVAENGLLFEVNFTEYLDTGLFLDHRDTRAWIRDHAAGTNFLNLFAYTGSATVYAAAGGAASTTTVDLSSTYLRWTTRNLAANGLAGGNHESVHADVLTWISEARAAEPRYDLIFCDPPTFSNSKRMDATFDVQRDHAELLASVAELLTDDGTLFFSCNRRKFQLDLASLEAAGLVAKDITRSTIPKDFERTPEVHSCWLITKV